MVERFLKLFVGSVAHVGRRNAFRRVYSFLLLCVVFVLDLKSSCGLVLRFG